MVTAYYELTTLCPCSCSFCHIPSKLRRTSPIVRNFGEIASDFPRLREIGIESIVLSGGEPSTRFILPEIAEYARRYFKKVAVISNGINIDTLQKTLAYATVWLSIDYYGEKQDAHREFKGLWQNYLKLAEHVNVRSTLLHDNVKDLKLLIEETAKNKRQVTIVPYRGKDKKLAPTKKDMTALLGFIFTNNYELTAIVDDPSVRAYIATRINQPFIGCNACDGVIRVNVQGQVTPCPFLDTVICDLYDPEIKGKLAKTKADLAFMLTGKCLKCINKFSCGGCKASLNYHCILP